MIRSVLALVIVVLISSCQKKNEQEPVKQDIPPGNINGRVKHYTHDGVENNHALNTTTVLIENSNHKTFTDTLGQYKFDELPTGYYTLSFHKPGTGLCKKEEIFLEAGSTLQLNADLADTASWFLTEVRITDTLIKDQKYMLVKVQTPHSGRQLYAQVFFSKKNEIDSRKKASYDLQSNIIIPVGQIFSDKVIAYALLTDIGYKNGEKFFAKIYPINPNAGYKDKSDTWICTGAGLAYQTFTLTMP